MVAALTFLTGVVAALILTPLVGGIARRRGWLDYPDGLRKTHLSPVPRLGGVAVYGAFVLAFGVYLALSPDPPEDVAELAEVSLHLIAACGLVMLVGLADDLHRLRPASKIAGQALAGLYLYVHGYRIDMLTNPWGEPMSLGMLSLPLTLLWFVGMSNAFNLIDGLDGLAAGVGFVATSSLMMAALLSGRWGAVALTLALAGALLGFLRYNFSPASIFLGDSGSLFVGFALAAFSIPPRMKATAVIAVAAPLFALALPLLDVLLAVSRRILAGRNIFEADRDHIHHKLLQRGFTRRRAVIVLYGVAAVCGSLSLVTMTGPSRVAGAAVLVAGLMAFAGIHHLGYLEFGELPRLLMRRAVGERPASPADGALLDETLRRAQELTELWDAYVAAAARLGFTRVEIDLDPSLEEGVLEPSGARPSVHGFPVWEAEPGSGRPGWSLSITLVREGDRLGNLRLVHPRLEPPAAFDPAELIDAARGPFAERLAFFLWRPGFPLPLAPTGPPRA